MQLPSEATDLDGRRTVNDPCCGSGRMLLAAAELQPHWHFIGQDVDVRCVRMTAINLALRNIYGHVVCGNTLTQTTESILETGRVHVWGNAIRKTTRVPISTSMASAADQTTFAGEPEMEHPADQESASQLRLF